MIDDQPFNDNTPFPPGSPYYRLGSGPTTALLWKVGSATGPWRYRFRLVRQSACEGSDASLFDPADIASLIKLLQVVTATVVADGCVTDERRHQLNRLAEHLDELLRHHLDEDLFPQRDQRRDQQ